MGPAANVPPVEWVQALFTLVSHLSICLHDLRWPIAQITLQHRPTKTTCSTVFLAAAIAHKSNAPTEPSYHVCAQQLVNVIAEGCNTRGLLGHSYKSLQHNNIGGEVESIPAKSGLVKSAMTPSKSVTRQIKAKATPKAKSTPVIGGTQVNPASSSQPKLGPLPGEEQGKVPDRNTGCPKSFQSYNRANDHMSRDCKYRPSPPIECGWADIASCSETFPNLTSRARHEKRHFRNPGIPHPCLYNCGERYPDYYSLANHEGKCGIQVRETSHRPTSESRSSKPR